MDNTLTQILRALYEAHQSIDALQKRVAELEATQSNLVPFPQAEDESM